MKLLGHGLRLDGQVEVAELRFHIDDALVAYGAFVGRLDVLPVAVAVHCVAALHDAHGLGRAVEILATNGTIAVQRPFDAPVVHLEADGQASAAFLRRMLAPEPWGTLGDARTLQ